MLFNFEKKAPHDAAEQLEDANRLLKTISPLVSNISNNRSLFMIGQGMGMFTEFLLYLIAIVCFFFWMIVNRVFPFYILGEIIDKRIYEDALASKGDIEAFHIGVKALVVIIGILLIVIGMMKRQHRLQRSLLQQSASELKMIEHYFVHKKETLEKLSPAASATLPANSDSPAVEGEPPATPPVS